MSTAPHILVVDDEPDIRRLLKEILEDEDYSVSTAEDAASARQARRDQRPDLILLDIWMPDVDGITLLKEWTQEEPLNQPVIIMSGHGNVETAVEATRLGAYDYIEKPLSLAKLLLTIEHALQNANLLRENVGLRQANQPISEPIGRSHQFRQLRQQALQIAQHETPVLLRGEPGSGKHLFARYLHNNSARRNGPFLRADINVITTKDQACQLLFGSEAGEQVQYGLLDQAHGGTLYIDDIADLDLQVQQLLLRLLKEGQYTRHSGSSPVTANVRLIVASRHALEQSIALQQFNEDLYYQLNVVSLYVPALREHSEDVLDLVAFYSDYFIETDKLPYHSFTTAALNRLRQHPWPGNVRELKNLVQRLLIIGHDRQLDISDIEEAIGQQRQGPDSDLAAAAYELPLRQARERFERSYFEVLLRRFEGSVNQVAQHAGMERTHLYRKLRSLGIDPKRYSSR